MWVYNRVCEVVFECVCACVGGWAEAGESELTYLPQL